MRRSTQNRPKFAPLRVPVLAAVVAALLLPACSDPVQPVIARGNVLRNQGELEAAVEAYREAVEMAPSRAEAHERLGETLFDLGRLDEARDAWTRAAEIAPRSPDGHMGLAKIAAAGGDRAAAIRHLSDVLAHNDRNLYALMSRGNLHLQAGDVAAAVEDYARAVAMERHNTSALYGYGSALLAADDPENARTAFERLERVDPNSPLGAYGLARLAMAETRPDDALPLLEEALRRARALGVALDADALKDDAHFAALAGEPAFRRLVDAAAEHGQAEEDGP